MKIGVVGLGKLGLPVALCIASRGHSVIGFDPRYDSTTDVLSALGRHERGVIIAEEEGTTTTTAALVDELSPDIDMRCADSLDAVVSGSELVFVAIQTPHKKSLGGQCPLPDERADFDYSFLVSACTEIAKATARSRRHSSPLVLCVISTVLPGTLRREIVPIFAGNKSVQLCYNPYFIAMGTVASDFFSPEMVLFGRMDKEAEDVATRFYATIHDVDVFSTTLENAELIKVSYNTFITTKIVMTNNLMEMCHHIPNTDIDTVMNALGLATKRLISKAYLRGGLGDAGGCHPRDNVAMSWLSDKLGIQNNYYEFIMGKRESQTAFLADLVCNALSLHPELNNVAVVVLGYAFKPNLNLMDGSCAFLLKHMLDRRGITVRMADPVVESTSVTDCIGKVPAVYFVGCLHDCLRGVQFPEGSVVIDVNRAFSHQQGVELVCVGRGR